MLHVLQDQDYDFIGIRAVTVHVKAFVTAFSFGGIKVYAYINLFGLNIPSYGLCMAVGFFLCSFLIVSRARRCHLIIEDIIIFLAVVVGSALVGGGILYIVVSYRLDEIAEYIKNLDFSFITNGGIVFYGGLIGGIIGGFLTVKILKIDLLSLEKCVVPFIAPGHAIGRIGCLLAGCCYGMEYNGPFAVKSGFVASDISLFPVQALEAVLDLMIFPFLLWYSRKVKVKYRLLTLYLICYSSIRLITECFRGDAIRGGYLGISTSQWISLIILPLSVCALAVSYKKTRDMDKN